MALSRFQFTLRALLIALTVTAVCIAIGGRVVAGSLAERRAASDAAMGFMKDQGLYSTFEVQKVRSAGTNPRKYRVFMMANKVKPVAVVVVEQDGKYTLHAFESDHTR